MKNNSKRYKSLLEKFDVTKTYSLSESCQIVKELRSAKFDESIEIAMNLNVDPRHADHMIRGAVVLPFGTGKVMRVAVFAKGVKADEATAAGADIVGSDNLVEEIQSGKIDFDVLIATPDMMGLVGKLGRVLGPKGLMPNPKTGTVTVDVAKAVEEAKGGKVTYKVDKKGNIHAGIGKVSFDLSSIEENLKTFIRAINRAKPSTAKGKYILNASIALTMSPGIKLTTQELMELK